MFKKNDRVTVDLLHKTLVGMVTKDTQVGDKYVNVKHDHFQGEMFKISQVKKVK